MLHKEIEKSKQIVADLLDEIQHGEVNNVLLPRLNARTKDYTRENIRNVREIERTRKTIASGHVKLQNIEHLQLKTLPVPKVNPLKTRPSTSIAVKMCPKNAEQEEMVKEYKNKIPVASERKYPRPPMVTRLNLDNTDNVKAVATVSKDKKTTRSCYSTPAANSNGSYSHTLGIIPKYLLIRKKQLLENKEKEIPAAVKIPPGHTLLTDEERLDTLEMLKKNEKELINRLSSLPFCINTLRRRQQKEDIEKQLQKIEDGIQIFSRPQVFVKS